jgi:hypothetical protein
MRNRQRSFRLERLEDRCALSGTQVPGMALPQAAGTTPTLVGDLNHDGVVNTADEKIFVLAFGASIGKPNYNPAADFNHNGFVGQGDGKILLAHLTNPGPDIPLRLRMSLAPGQQARTPHSANSGGVAHQLKLTIVGKTTPQSLVFFDSGQGDYKFNGGATYADDQGNFQHKVTMSSPFTTFNFLIIDPHGHKLIHSFPVRTDAPIPKSK